MKLVIFRRVAVVPPLMLARVLASLVLPLPAPLVLEDLALLDILLAVPVESVDALSEVQQIPSPLLDSVPTVDLLVVALADFIKLIAILAGRAELRVILGTSLRALLIVSLVGA